MYDGLQLNRANFNRFASSSGSGLPVNPIRFGAVWDGVTNDYAAIQAALTYAVANGLPLLIPPGIGACGSQLTINQTGTVAIVGYGPVSNVKFTNAASAGFNFLLRAYDVGTGVIDRLSMSDFGILAGAVHTDAAIKAIYTAHTANAEQSVHIRNIDVRPHALFGTKKFDMGFHGSKIYNGLIEYFTFQGATSAATAGIYLNNCINVNVENCTPTYAVDGAHVTTGDGAIAVTGNTHSNTTVDNISPNTTGMTAGMTFSGVGIPTAPTTNVTIVSVDSATQVTLSHAATATASGVNLWANGQEQSEGVHIENSVFYNCTRALTVDGVSTYAQKALDIRVSGSHGSTTEEPVSFDQVQQSSILNNLFYTLTAAESGIIDLDGFGNEIAFNQIIQFVPAGAGVGIDIQGAGGGHTIKGNYISGYGTGLKLGAGTISITHGNTLLGCTTPLSDLGTNNQNVGTTTLAAGGSFTSNTASGPIFTSPVRFGGATASFPALKQESTGLSTKTADDSAYAQHTVLQLSMVDGVTAPSATVGFAKLFVDTADGDLKIIFGDGTTKTIVVDT